MDGRDRGQRSSGARCRACRRTPTRWTGCAACGLTGCKEGCAEGECGACAVLVARPATTARTRTEWTAINACLVPVAASTARRSSPPRASARPSELHPVQQRDGRARRLAVRLLHARASSAAWRPSTTGAAGTVAPTPTTARGRRRPRRRRARPQRLRPARAQRQPVPLHRLPADPGRGVRPRHARAGRPARRAPRGRPAPAAVADPARRAPTAVRAARRPRPRRCALLRRDPTPCSSPARTDWGVEREPRGRPCAADASRIERLAELRALDVGDDRDRDRRRAHARRDRAPPRRPRAAARRDVPAVRVAGSSATARRSAATSAPPRRSATRRPRCSPSRRGWCSPRPTASAR